MISYTIYLSNVFEKAAELRTRPDIIVASPGRLLDHLTNSSGVDLDDLEFLGELDLTIVILVLNRATILPWRLDLSFSVEYGHHSPPMD